MPIHCTLAKLEGGGGKLELKGEGGNIIAWLPLLKYYTGADLNTLLVGCVYQGGGALDLFQLRSRLHVVANETHY